MARYKQIIHIEGRCVEDILRLSCVKGCEKTSVYGVLRFSFYPLAMAHPQQFQFAETGDFLCEDYEGRWHVIKGKDADNLDK